MTYDPKEFQGFQEEAPKCGNCEYRTTRLDKTRPYHPELVYLCQLGQFPTSLESSCDYRPDATENRSGR